MNFSWNTKSLKKPKVSLFEDDEEEDKMNLKKKVKLEDKNSDSDDVDLDKYLNEMECQAEKDLKDAGSNQNIIRRDDIEEEDFVESYINELEKKGIANLENITEEDAEEQAKLKAKVVEPLPPVDHSSIEYLPISKYFYREHEDIKNLDKEKVESLRREMDIHVLGTDVAKPCISFSHFNLDKELLNVISKQGYSQPSDIQKQAVPVALEGRDIIGIAKTGSGKTAAYLLPLMVHIMDQPELEQNEGPIGLILAPTRELAIQIYKEAKIFANAYKLKVSCVFGGASKHEQFKALRQGYVDILIATPGRLIDMIKMKATNFKRVSFLVLDEVDQMLDLNFEPQVMSIANNVRPDRQTLLFSATFPERIQNIARSLTMNPVTISIGTEGLANEDIDQKIVLLKNEEEKNKWLIKELENFLCDGSVLIFVARKAFTEELSKLLTDQRYPCIVIHGDLNQIERDAAIKQFRSNPVSVLIATDVAARGLDIKHIRNVVHYNPAKDIETHIHRSGRTGRAGAKGTSFCLLSPSDDRFAGELVKMLELAGKDVSKELMNLAMSNFKFKRARLGISTGPRSGQRRSKKHKGF
ncbi:DEAD-domain-containing protein [Rozella allomycis CSF55]|uniref:RNA helicase n=1 Tax=Rozella allomycis (strain CSF55) TaxID=988480 RepID=A0A075APP8_ROZAC|nr:DNA/RNA helicase, DEAD/DEAH box type domain-containing protein [Rozella allomycis CSF55]RKP19764.1 DEAD-domain-containing protein [Rozella allomycis CSF55]|eukprot:EPZ32154.1 DNA/RNA helicase, DEAD/DEAH box type domain-containing protein [Rozella allomycis CSF55]